MTHIFKLTALTLAVITAPAISNDDIKISGFGSIVGGVVLEGDGYWARMPEAAGQYVSGLELKTESRVGVQARYAMTEKTSITGQVMLRGINEFKPDMEWLYVSHHITPDWKLNAGQMRLPVYHFSDYMDVGVAYPWLRVPSDAYSLAVTNYQGASLQYSLDYDWGWSNFQLYGGQQDTNPNKLLNVIGQYELEQVYDDNGKFMGVRDIQRTKDYKDMKGLVIDTHVDNFALRLSYLHGREIFTHYLPGDYPESPLYGGEWGRTRFIDISLQYDNGKINAIAEWNNYQGIYTSWFASFVYRFDRVSPYIYYTTFESELRGIAPGGAKAGFESFVDGSIDNDYNTLAIGARYDVNPRFAVKVEWLNFNDVGDAAVFIDQNQDGDTDSQAFFVSLDFTF